MEDKNQLHNSTNDELDAALAKYAAVEPRAGFEERILASLRSDRARVRDRAWWQWTVAAALAAVLVVAAALIEKSNKPAPMAQHHPTGTETALQPPAQAASRSERGTHLLRLPSHGKAAHGVHRAIVTAASPVLDQFPSPQPLSEQEKILEDYVAEHHQQAALLARARMAELKQDLAEEMRDVTASSDGSLSEPPEDQRTDR